MKSPFHSRFHQHLKGFDAAINVDDTNKDRINIQNHFFATGTRVIYDDRGGTPIGGLTHNQLIIILLLLTITTSNLLLTEADALAILLLLLTSKALVLETQRFISSNLSGEVTGAGTVEVTNGSRTVVGTDTSFERFFKIGDTIKFVDPATTPGVIKERQLLLFRMT